MLDNSEIIDSTIDPVCTVAELITALQALVRKPDTVYISFFRDAPTALKIEVIERTLSDGSTVEDINIVDLNMNIALKR